MDEILIQHAQTYVHRNNLRLAERLGHGIHGILYAAERNAEAGNVAIKVLRSRDAYERERDAYLRLGEANMDEILGFNVPKLIRFDEELLVIEMTIVARPFVLDFAGAYLDYAPQFSDEIWREWENEKRDQFENLWPKVQAVLAALEALGIYLVDAFATRSPLRPSHSAQRAAVQKAAWKAAATLDDQDASHLSACVQLRIARGEAVHIMVLMNSIAFATTRGVFQHGSRRREAADFGTSNISASLPRRLRWKRSSD